MDNTTKNTTPRTPLTFDTLMPYLRKHRYLSIAAISWLVMIGLAVFIVVPQVNTISTDLGKMNQESQTLDGLNAKISFLHSLSPGEVKTQLITVTSALPALKPVLPLLSVLESTAAQSGVSVGNLEVNPGDVATGSAGKSIAGSAGSSFPGINGLPLKADIVGTFPDINSFFKQLDQSIPIVNVNSIQFIVNSQIAGDQQYKATVAMEALYTPPLPANTQFVPTPLSVSDRLLISTLSAQLAAQAPLQQDVNTAGLGRANVFSY